MSDPALPMQELIDRLEGDLRLIGDDTVLGIDLRDAIAALKAAPGLCDRPTTPGRWIEIYDSGYCDMDTWSADHIAEFAAAPPEATAGRQFLGPLPERK